MIGSFHQVREVQKRHNGDLDLRTAAFINSIDKIMVCYEELGIFP
jgi:glutamate dehydrogenase (NAD(P)+)